MAISKFVVTSAGQVMVMVIYTIVGSITAELMFGKYITGYDITHLFAALGVKLLLHLAINAIIVFLCTLTKNHSIAMVAGCIFGLGITKVAYLSIDLILSFMKINFSISNYMPDGLIDQLGWQSVGSIAQKAIIVSIAFIVAFVAANYYVVRNRDVR
jgi:ABC-type transport system involved in multi-copper enzyme maturation permease subunit